ncbi:hypothetical protein C6P45_002518 [Maudiozyma exigua]|uniref:Arf-GAP domain-containing protein n=1 Tax=Maudiozyma exigua TaxID=34358 RepID=A0A9P6VY44_MAUEX|nr:hypothetical protein C6P45_002518 [Kazachstania exigua]
MSTTIPVKKALTALLRDPGNSMCADCKSQSHPRWASWSLGVFICIKCAGVHRSLGTHVSKVKSVDLDTWKEEHLKMLIKMQNNLIANLYYEAKLDSETKKNLGKNLLDSNKLQNFIKNKYEYKKWIGDSIPTSVETTKENILFDDSITSTPTPVTKSNESLLSDNMNKLNISHNNSTNLLKTQKSNTSNNSLVNLEKLSSSISNGSASNISSTASINNSNTSNTTNSKLNQRPDLKKSILSLYSKSTANVRNPTMTSTNSNTLMNQISSHSSSNSSINVNSNNNNTNNWSSVLNNNNNNKTNSALSLDDNELFKNVWS